VFPTGYAANLGVLGAVTTAGGRDNTVVFSDELNHASIIDGTRLGRMATDVYPHGDLEELGRRMRVRSRPHAVVVTDVVFSMDGDVTDVAALSRLCAEQEALLILDVAHDVFEVTEHLDPAADVLVVGTLSKTLGSLGGYVVGTRTAIDLLLNTARPFIFSTATPPPMAAAAQEALRIVQSSEGTRLRARLRDNIDRLRPGHPSPIIPVIIGSDEDAMRVSAGLLEAGLLVPAIRPPTVPAGTSRLRITLSAQHTRGELDRLKEALDQLGVPLPETSTA
jgi:7-keto-8-aminopelargonate synthetase-like enzyme